MVKTQPSNAGVVGSIPGQGTEISHAARRGQKVKISLKKKKTKHIRQDYQVYRMQATCSRRNRYLYSSYRHSQPLPLTLDSHQKGGILGAGHDLKKGPMRHKLPRTT